MSNSPDIEVAENEQVNKIDSPIHKTDGQQTGLDFDTIIHVLQTEPRKALALIKGDAQEPNQENSSQNANLKIKYCKWLHTNPIPNPAIKSKNTVSINQSIPNKKIKCKVMYMTISLVELTCCQMDKANT